MKKIHRGEWPEPYSGEQETAFFFWQDYSVCVHTGYGKGSFSFSLSLAKKEEVASCRGFASPSCHHNQTAPYTHCVSPQSISNLCTLESHRIWSSSCHQPVYTFPFVQTKRFSFETHGVFLILENIICYLVFWFVFPFPLPQIYSSKCLLSTSSCTPGSIFQRPLPFLFWLGVSDVS